VGIMRVDVESFSFKKDRCDVYDYVLDARTLDLRGYGIIWLTETGLDQRVQEIAGSAPEFKTIVAAGVGFVMSSDAQQANDVHIGIGCLHGRHRSVTVAEGLVERLNQLSYFDVHVHHRQLM
jgi:RNase adaptor protein for sRNA GlmZ degradation